MICPDMGRTLAEVARFAVSSLILGVCFGLGYVLVSRVVGGGSRAP